MSSKISLGSKKARGSGIKTSTPLRSTDRRKSSSKVVNDKIPDDLESPDAGIKSSTPLNSTERKMERRRGSSKKIEIKPEDLNAMIESSTPLRPPRKAVAKTPDSEVKAETLKRRSGSRILSFEKAPAVVPDGSKKRKAQEEKKVGTVQNGGDDLFKGDAKGKTVAGKSSKVGKGKAKKVPKKLVKAAVEDDHDVGASKENRTSASKATLDSAGVIVAAVESLADAKGLTSLASLQKYINSEHPEWKKMTFTGGLKRALAKGRIQKIKNSFRIVQKKAGRTPRSKKTAEKGSKGKSSKHIEVPLEDLLPHVFTWVVEPKQSTTKAIQNYISTHFQHLKTGVNDLKEAIKTGIAKGQLIRVSGSTANGIFRLVDGAPKTGTQIEDAIEDAIIASTEPKECSFKNLREYLTEYHSEYEVDDNPKVLLRALEKSEESGSIKRISAKGMSGTFRLAINYCPSPKDLWREAYNESDYLPKENSEEAKSEDDEEEEDAVQNQLIIEKQMCEDGSDNDGEGEDDPAVKAAPAKRSKPLSKKKSTPKKTRGKKPTPKRRRR